jgi:23S rRNA pseudouridine2605 synthase
VGVSASSIKCDKIQKILASIGLGSRRSLEEAILAGRILVQQERAHLGQRIAWGTDVRIDGKRVLWPKQRLVATKGLKIVLYHKPVGQICSHVDSKGRETVFAHLPVLQGERWCMVGRLDVNSSGLLLFTNDGTLAAWLQHPSHELLRVYRVRVLGQITTQQKQQLCQGVPLADGRVCFSKVRMLRQKDGAANQWLEVSIGCGKQRVVRRMFAHFNMQVNRLIRVSFGALQLPEKLRQSQYYCLTPKENAVFLKSLPGYLSVAGQASR